MEKIGTESPARKQLQIADPMMETRLPYALILAAVLFEDFLFDAKERDAERLERSVVKILCHGLGVAGPVPGPRRRTRSKPT
jgi:hypothetical protein